MGGRLRGSVGIGLAAIAAAMLVVAGLFAAPARAQQELEGIVVDLVVEVEQGECGEGVCADDERPVTFDARLVVDEAASDEANNDVDLTPDQVDDLNEALDGVELTDELIDITVTDSEGDEVATPEDEESICLQSGEFDVTATVDDQATPDALESDVVDALDDINMVVEPDDVTINDDFDEPFTVAECDDDNGDDDRDQTNVCNQVVNIVLENVQNPNVNNTQNADVDVNNPPDEPVDELPAEELEAGDDLSDEQLADVTNEQVVDIAQELNVSPVIVQTCIQQNAGRDANINSNNDDNNDDDFIDDDNNNGDDFIDDNNDDDFIDDDEDFNVQDDGRGQVLAGTYPNQNLPNTGGISPAAVLAGLGFALLIAGLSVGYAVARRRS